MGAASMTRESGQRMPSAFPGLRQVAGLTSHGAPEFLVALQGDRPKLGYSDVCNWLPALRYTSSSRLVPERQRHMTTWQTASREYLHVADLPFQPWKDRLTSCSAIP